MIFPGNPSSNIVDKFIIIVKLASIFYQIHMQMFVKYKQYEYNYAIIFFNFLALLRF